MRKRSSVALAFGAVCWGSILAAEAFLELTDQYTWNSYAEDFGGLSGLEVSEDGERFVAVSDSGILYEGTFVRNDEGRLQEHQLRASTALVDEAGIRSELKKFRDMEGLALAENGDMHISTEFTSLILKYAHHSDTPTSTPLPRLEGHAQLNKGFEALAISPTGHFITISEGSDTIKAPFDILQRDNAGGWSAIYSLPRHGGFRPVGADFGPDGHLYVLTRAFNGFAFATHITRVRFKDGLPQDHQRLFTGQFGQFDNLEGLAVWRDKTGNLRVSTVSDDNFSALQTTEIVEFRLQE